MAIISFVCTIGQLYLACNYIALGLAISVLRDLTDYATSLLRRTIDFTIELISFGWRSICEPLIRAAGIEETAREIVQLYKSTSFLIDEQEKEKRKQQSKESTCQKKKGLKDQRQVNNEKPTVTATTNNWLTNWLSTEEEATGDNGLHNEEAEDSLVDNMQALLQHAIHSLIKHLESSLMILSSSIDGDDEFDQIRPLDTLTKRNDYESKVVKHDWTGIYAQNQCQMIIAQTTTTTWRQSADFKCKAFQYFSGAEFSFQLTGEIQQHRIPYYR